MENRSHAFAAGAFVLLVAALLVAMAAWLTRDTQEHRSFELSTREAVTGLQPQASVRYKGVLVGRVTSLGLDRAQPGAVLVRIAINDEVPITTSTFAALGFQGVTGLAFIQLDDKGESTVALASTPDKPGRIPVRPGLFTRLSEQGVGLLGQLDETSRRVNLLLAPENQQTLVTAIAKLGQAAASIDQLAQGPGMQSLLHDSREAAAAVKASANRVGDSADTVKTSAAAFQRVTTRMNAPGGTLDAMEQGADALVATGQVVAKTVVPRLNRTADEATRTVRQLGRTADTLQDNPQVLLWGQGAAAPGPGESGFVAPPAAPLKPLGTP